MSLFLMYKKNTAQKTCVTVISKLTDFFHINTRLVDLEGGGGGEEKKNAGTAPCFSHRGNNDMSRLVDNKPCKLPDGPANNQNMMTIKNKKQ